MVSPRQAIAEFAIRNRRLDNVIAARERDRAALPLDNNALAGLALPVFLVHGVANHVIPPVRSWELVNLLPTADAVALHGCGRWSQIERPGSFSRLVIDFVLGQWQL